jgi:hypothetical protein
VASFLLLVSLSAAKVESSPSSEYRLKAAFLYNFAKFIEWPTEAMGNASQPFNICFVGDKSVSRELQQVVSGKSIADHNIQVLQVRIPADSRGCHILFITATATSQEPRFLALLRDSSVLTVGETPGFCSRGGVINFWIDSDRVRFEISPKASQHAHLLPSSKLLRLARVVDPSSEAGGGQ